MCWAEAITGAAGLGSSAIGAQSAGSVAGQAQANSLAAIKRQIQWEKDQANKRLEMGQGYQATGESGLMNEMAAAPGELGQMRSDIENNATIEQNRALGQTKLGLAQQGVGGAQAARGIARSAGELNRGTMSDVNRLAYEDAIRRSNAKAGYFGSKALGGQSMVGTY